MKNNSETDAEFNEYQDYEHRHKLQMSVKYELIMAYVVIMVLYNEGLVFALLLPFSELWLGLYTYKYIWDSYVLSNFSSWPRNLIF